MLTTYMSRGFLWGSLGAWREGPWKIAIVVSPCLLFTWPLEREVQCASRRSCALLSHDSGQEIASPTQAVASYLETRG